MKWILAVGVVLYGLQEAYVTSTSLQIQVNGFDTNAAQIGIGNNLTFVCTLQVSAFQWTVGSLLTGNDGVVSLVVRPRDRKTSGIFTLTAYDSNPRTLTYRSTLEVIASPELSGIKITCADNLNENNNQTTVVTICDASSASLKVEINGHITDKRQYCIAESLTFICTIPTNTVQWTAGDLLSGINGSITTGLGRNLNERIFGIFRLTALGGDNPNCRSTLQVSALAELNDTVITCADAFNQSINRSITVRIYGPPSIFADTTIMNYLNNSTLKLLVPLSMTAKLCLRSISATLSWIDGTNVLRTQERSMEINGSAAVISFEMLNFCDNIYNYTLMSTGDSIITSISEEVVVPHNGQPSAPRISDIFSSIQNSDPSFILTIEPPVRHAECVKNYTVSVLSDGQFHSVQVPVNSSTITSVSINRANLINFNPCLYNYLFQVRSSNGVEPSNLVEGHFDFSGYKGLSCLSQDGNAVHWLIPNEIGACIARLQYSLQNSKISGFLEPNVTSLPLDLLNVSTTCYVDFITITPVFHVRSDPIAAASVTGIIYKDEMCPTERSVEYPIPVCKYETYIGSLVGIIVIAIATITAIMSINAILICKIIRLRQNIDLNKEKPTNGTGVKYVNNNETNEFAVTNSAVVNIVECQAYGTVLQPIAYSTTGETESHASTGIYEAI